MHRDSQSTRGVRGQGMSARSTGAIFYSSSLTASLNEAALLTWLTLGQCKPSVTSLNMNRECRGSLVIARGEESRAGRVRLTQHEGREVNQQ
ncbi:hypothetical protein SRHO_G00216530 [Serrasalmus rhombeus]